MDAYPDATRLDAWISGPRANRHPPPEVAGVVGHDGRKNFRRLCRDENVRIERGRTCGRHSLLPRVRPELCGAPPHGRRDGEIGTEARQLSRDAGNWPAWISRVSSRRTSKSATSEM